ncbi:MAG: hypothetical protein PHY64_13850 [Eubacteriales bacterium]|nr:hypothetical protein [Eubacteriales bacterium]
MSQIAYDSNQAFDSRYYQPTDRFYVRSSVYLPSGDMDPVSGMLRRDSRRRGRTQALRMEARLLDREYEKMQAAIAARQKEKGFRISLRYGVLIIVLVSLVLATVLLVQQGTLLQRRQDLEAMQQRIEAIQEENAAIRAQIEEDSDAATICYAAAQNLGMVPASSTQAIHLTAVDTRPGENTGRVVVTADAQNTVDINLSAGQ